jgi:glutathione S-transferase
MEGFRAYALSSALIAVQLVLLAFYTGFVRSKHKQYVNPEDAKTLKGDHAEREHADVLRAQRAHANLLENAVPFFVVGALYVRSGATVRGAQAYCYTFLAARLLHTVFYLLEKQPFRTISFGIGALSILGMAFHVIRAAL